MWFLVRFVPALGSRACHDELDALLSMHGVEPRTAYARTRTDAHTGVEQEIDVGLEPFCPVSVPSSQVMQAIISRSVMIVAGYEVYAHGNTLHEAVDALSHTPVAVLDEIAKADPPPSWRITVDVYGAKLDNTQKRGVIAHVLEMLHQPGPVKLSDAATHTFSIVVDTGRRTESENFVLNLTDAATRRAPVATSMPAVCYPATMEGPRFASRVSGGFTPEDCASGCICALREGQTGPPRAFSPAHVYIGRSLGHTGRRWLDPMNLRARAYLGPTSLEPELALLMCNVAKITKNDVVADPFVGTGSIVVAAAKCGAFTMGMDIDIRVLYGKLGRNIATNFEQYGLGVPECIRLDTAGAALRPGALFDAIVTDPPYGVRAAARKSGVKDPTEVKSIPEPLRATHIPRTQVYEGDELMVDLMDYAARRLTVGGRIVYLLPVGAADPYAAYIPEHPCLRVYARSAQRLGLMLSRLIVGMEKIAEYDMSKAAEYREQSIASATRAGWFTTTIRDRMGQAYDEWYASMREHTPAIHAEIQQRKRGRQSDAGSAALAGDDRATHDEASSAAVHAVDAASDAAEPTGSAAEDGSGVVSELSGAKLKEFRRRLFRQERREKWLASRESGSMESPSPAASVSSRPEKKPRAARKAADKSGDAPKYRHIGQVPFDVIPLQLPGVHKELLASLRAGPAAASPPTAAADTATKPAGE